MTAPRKKPLRSAPGEGLEVPTLWGPTQGAKWAPGIVNAAGVGVFLPTVVGPTAALVASRVLLFGIVVGVVGV
jgi:hypothetical protein